MNRRIELPRQMRAAEIRSKSFDAGDNSVELTFATSTPVRRYSARGEKYDEVLTISEFAIDRSRLDAGTMPLLNSHRDFDISDVVGNITAGSLRIANGAAIARARLSTAARDSDTVEKVKNGILSACSIGYAITSIEVDDRGGDTPTWTVTRWTPIEISLVAVGADPNARIRSATIATYPCELRHRPAPFRDPNDDGRGQAIVAFTPFESTFETPVSAARKRMIERMRKAGLR